MEIPRAGRPQGPWSPLSYRVIEVSDEKIPVTEADSQPGCPSRARETTPPPRLPWALPGYRVVEEKTSSGPTPRPSPGVGAARGSLRRKLRPPLVRWGAVAGCGVFLVAAVIALGSHRQPTWARDAGDHA